MPGRKPKTQKKRPVLTLYLGSPKMEAIAGAAVRLELPQNRVVLELVDAGLGGRPWTADGVSVAYHEHQQRLQGWEPPAPLPDDLGGEERHGIALEPPPLLVDPRRISGAVARATAWAEKVTLKKQPSQTEPEPSRPAQDQPKAAQAAGALPADVVVLLKSLLPLLDDETARQNRYRVHQLQSLCRVGASSAYRMMEWLEAAGVMMRMGDTWAIEGVKP
jgi:hypothetical protein